MRCHKPPSTEGKLRNSDAQAGSRADAKGGVFVFSNMTEAEAGTHSSLLLVIKNLQILNGSKKKKFPNCATEDTAANDWQERAKSL